MLGAFSIVTRRLQYQGTGVSLIARGDQSMANFEQVTDGLRFPEGPVAMPDGSIILTEIERGTITRVTADGTKTIIATTGGGPNGLAVGPDGKLYCCNNGGFNWNEGGGFLSPHGIADTYSGGRIERIDIATGAVEILYKSGDFGCVLRGPNDIVFDNAGGFWFTDHGKQDFKTRAHDIVGIFYGKADGSHLEEVIFPSNNPNGIGLSPDGKILYAAETYTCRLVSFDVIAPGKVADAAGPGGAGNPLYRPAGWKFFDSLGMEANGNICVATIGESGISVVSPAGELVEFVATDDLFTTNICFGGADMMDAWITCSSTGRLLKTRWNRPGLKLNH
jgi:gluconolactonase